MTWTRRRWLLAIAPSAVTAAATAQQLTAPRAAPSAEAAAAAVVVLSAPAAARELEHLARSRMEALLARAGWRPLDETRARALRDDWRSQLAPGEVMTAEKALQHAERFRLQRIFELGFTTGAFRPLGLYHSATCNLQLRVIDGESMRVDAVQSKPMGTRGFAAPDAVTAEAALSNAVLRAVDDAAIKAGLIVADQTPPTDVQWRLQLAPEPAGPAVEMARSTRGMEPSFAAQAGLVREAWRQDTVKCSALSPDGGYGVVGTRSWTQDRFSREMPRVYGGFLIVVDLAAGKPIHRLVVHEMALRLAGEDGNSGVLDCEFLGGWRHLLACSGNRLACWDLERGKELASESLAPGFQQAQLTVLRSGGALWVRLSGDRGIRHFSMTAT